MVKSMVLHSSVLSAVLAFSCILPLVLGDQGGTRCKSTWYFFLDTSWLSSAGMKVSLYLFDVMVIVPPGVSCNSTTSSALCNAFALDCVFSTATQTCSNSQCFGQSDATACRINCPSLDLATCYSYEGKSVLVGK